MKKQLVVVPLLLALTACSGVRHDVAREDLEKAVAAKLTESDLAFGAVTCPGDLRGEVDTELTCTMVAMDGTETPLVLTVTRAEGNDVRFDITVQQNRATQPSEQG
jgi:hypothetical protein